MQLLDRSVSLMKASKYHAGMSDSDRNEQQELFYG